MPHALDLDGFHETIATFLAEKSGQPRAQFGTSTPLISAGRVDSLLCMELFSFVEELVGTRIPTADFRLEKFDTIEAIYHNYFSPYLSQPSTGSCG
jgi:acyl carrier protein